ncbi:predicted protein [Histoplasma capsulatum G186AR]|uniref:Uncharacterized protein n=2 Tax=Ajellomyces capsulatus TaxID=5037 RepID=C0NKQ1_AJECG|nr:uncharacterized protein HCBG_03731 [Histoplasma capsulatum G186AR]EEH08442.1 predicted protein [Histoplasma capsulatum G186AR]KAG5299243.1 hypothetical protein I7I52_09494 [Histoplasma capsulatum]QSS68137.1 hypothetical protein I7I50_07434 [Histoplasma capsulatum G186AR]
MVISDKKETGTANEAALSTMTCVEIGGLPAMESNPPVLDDFKVVANSFDSLSITNTGTKSNDTTDDEIATPENDVEHEQENNNNSSGDDAASVISSTSSSVASSASTTASLSTQTEMALLARHVRSTLNEIVAAENTLATLPAYDVSEISEQFQQTALRILTVYMSLCDLFEQGESAGGYEMAATIRAVIAEYPTIRGRCGI